MEEYIVVNGFLSSPYAVSHVVGNSFYNLYRGLYSFAPFVVMSKAFISVHQSFSALVLSM
jgi:hypothetical protein